MTKMMMMMMMMMMIVMTMVMMCDQHSLHSWAAHQAAAVSSVADQLSSTQLGLTTQMS